MPLQQRHRCLTKILIDLKVKSATGMQMAAGKRGDFSVEQERIIIIYEQRKVRFVIEDIFPNLMFFK